MIKHNIILVECNPLYQILFEIKNNFLFAMKNFILKDLNNADLTNSIILSKFIHKDYLLKRHIQQFHCSKSIETKTENSCHLLPSIVS